MKLSRITSTTLVLALAGITLVLMSCSSATPTDTPGVDRMGRYVLKQFGPELWAVPDTAIGGET